MSNYIIHKGIKGWAKKNHKYISRYQKNGKWYYVYKNDKKYSKVQDWFGKDEHDEFRNAYNAENSDEYKRKSIFEQAEMADHLNKVMSAYYKTPMGKLEQFGRRTIGAGQDFISRITGKQHNDSGQKIIDKIFRKGFR